MKIVHTRIMTINKDRRVNKGRMKATVLVICKRKQKINQTYAHSQRYRKIVCDFFFRFASFLFLARDTNYISKTLSLGNVEIKNKREYEMKRQRKHVYLQRSGEGEVAKSIRSNRYNVEWSSFFQRVLLCLKFFGSGD